MSIAHVLAEKHHITVTPGVCGGRPCIAGTRIRVQDIVLRTESGASPDEILAAFPHVSLADIHAALAYYHDNRDAIDGQIAESDAQVAALKALRKEFRECGTTDEQLLDQINESRDEYHTAQHKQNQA